MLNSGLYEQVISEEIDKELETAANKIIEFKSIDSGESSKVLAQ